MSAHESVYVPHPLHAPDRAYRETNCYTDVLIELLHSRGLDPLAGFGHLVRTDFEGDQFTFFKMPPADIETLFGVDIHEMQPVGALPDQIERQLSRGATMLVELDAFFLPDTHATDYRRNHVKTTIAAHSIDQARQRLCYFHNTGRHELSGEDYRGVFGIGERRPDLLPPYLELARFDAGEPLTGDALKQGALELLRLHLSHRPRGNPFHGFGEQLERDLPALLDGSAEAFHAYAFATVRMAGASFDLLRSHVDWLLGTSAAPSLESIVAACHILSFRLARRRQFDAAPIIDTMAAAWASAMLDLESAVG